MREPSAPSKPRKRPEGRTRADRLAEALRANLARRKAQRRAREASAPSGTELNHKNEG